MAGGEQAEGLRMSLPEAIEKQLEDLEQLFTHAHGGHPAIHALRAALAAETQRQKELAAEWKLAAELSRPLYSRRQLEAERDRLRERADAAEADAAALREALQRVADADAEAIASMERLGIDDTTVDRTVVDLVKATLARPNPAEDKVLVGTAEYESLKADSEATRGLLGLSNELTAEVERLRVDARRWAYVRDELAQMHSPHMDGNHCWRFRSLYKRGPTVEAAVDAALAPEEEP